jgi:hypothetical protein
MERDCSEEEVQPTHSGHMRLHKRQTQEEPRRAVVGWPCVFRGLFVLVSTKTKIEHLGGGKIALAKRFVKYLRNNCQSSLEMMPPFRFRARCLLLVDRCLCPQRSPANRLFNDHRTPFRGHSGRGGTADPPNQDRKSYATATRRARRPQLIENKEEKMVPGVGVEPT